MDAEKLSDREILLQIHTYMGEVRGTLSMWRWVFGGTVLGGVGWLSWLTLAVFA